MGRILGSYKWIIPVFVVMAPIFVPPSLYGNLLCLQRYMWHNRAIQYPWGAQHLPTCGCYFYQIWCFLVNLINLFSFPFVAGVPFSRIYPGMKILTARFAFLPKQNVAWHLLTIASQTQCQICKVSRMMHMAWEDQSISKHMHFLHH